MQKVVFFFNQNNKGWTETWWAPGSSPTTTLLPGTKAVAAAAIAFRSPLTTLEWMRISVVGSPGKVVSFRMSNQVAPVTNPASRPDVVSTDALWRIVTNTYARRTISLRGLLDDSVLRNATSGAFEPTPGLVAQVNTYIRKAQGAGWMIRVTQNKVNTPGLVVQGVDLLRRGADSPAQTLVQFANPIPGLAVGSKLRFFGTIDPRQLPLFPRTPTVIALTAGPPQIATIGYTMPNAGPYAPVGMLSSLLNYNYEPIEDWDFQALSKRDTGRPFGSSRGRKSAAGSLR